MQLFIWINVFLEINTHTISLEVLLFLSCIYNYIVTYGCFDRNQLLTKNWARFMIDFSMIFQIRWQIGFSVTPS